MIGTRLSCFVKVVIGVLLLQVVTALLVVAALRSDLAETGPLFVLVAGLVGFLSAMWFASIYSGTQKLAVSRAREGFSKEREKIRVKAERDKAKLVVNQHKREAKVKAKTSGGGFGLGGISPKGSVAVLGVVGVGTVLLFSQFVTLGLAALAAVGGSMVGYKVRGFQQNHGGLGLSSAAPNDRKVLSAKSGARLMPTAKRLNQKDS
jgi:hypothetical protein